MYVWYDYLCQCASGYEQIYTAYVLLCPLYRFMKTHDRLSALRNARDTIRKRDRKISKIKVRLESLTSKRGNCSSDSERDPSYGIPPCL